MIIEQVFDPSRRNLGLVGGLLLALLLSVCAGIILLAITTPVSFDGGMNLEVARALADGEGYRRDYFVQALFPHEIQTHASYVLPSALVFKIFGVSVATTQLVNLLYLFGFALLSGSIVASLAGWRWGLGAALLCLLTPGVHRYGLNGYGEIVALFWWLWGSWILLKPARKERRASSDVLGGLLLGLALCSKTVLLIGVAVTVLVLFLQRLLGGLRPLGKALALTGLGLLLPIALIELWKLGAMGSENYFAWWSREAGAIFRQAGVSDSFHDSATLGEKLQVHSAALAGWLYLPVLAMASAFALLTGACLYAFARGRTHGFQWFMLALWLLCAVYLVWWLGVTPTEKAWHRRVFNAVVVFQLLSVIVAALLAGVDYKASAGRLGYRVLALTLLICPLWMAGAQSLALIEARVNPQLEQFQEALDVLASLPDESLLLGDRWYSAPTLALYSERSTQDIERTALPAALEQGPVYLVMDAPAVQAQAFESVLARYPVRNLTPELVAFRIYQVESELPESAFVPAEIDSNALHQCVRMDTDYPYLYGFYRMEPGQGRWARADAELVLASAESGSVGVDLYAPEPDRYLGEGDGVSVHAWLDDCYLGQHDILASGTHKLRWKVQCDALNEAHVTFRLATSRVVDSADHRQLALLVDSIGWAQSNDQGGEAPLCGPDSAVEGEASTAP